MKAVILAAGEGKRLQPITSTRSKHMIPLAGKPILEHLLRSLKEGGITDIVIITGYQEKLIQNYFQNGDQWNLKIEYIHQETPLGSGQAISLAEKYIEDDVFLVVYGDLLIKSSVIKSMIMQHKKIGLPILCVVPVDNPQQYGVVNLDENRVKGIIEKPHSTNTNLVNAGIYLFPKEIFIEARETPISARGEIEITDTIQRMLSKNVEIIPNRIKTEEWMDIGRPWDLLEANKRVLNQLKSDIKGEIEDNVHYQGVIHLEKDARLRSGTYIEGPIFIDGGCDIGPNCYLRPFTSIGKNVRIGNACEVKNSLILDRTHISHLSYIGDSLIGVNCNFGASTIIANLRMDKKNIKVFVKGELTDSHRRKLGVIMGDNVETGIGVQIMPGIKIGNDSWIGPSTTIYTDVPPQTVLFQKHERQQMKLKRTK